MQLVRVTAPSQRNELHSLSNSGQSASPFELFLIEGGNALVALMWTKIKEHLPLQCIIFSQHGCFLMTFPPKMHAQTASFLMPCASTRCFKGRSVVLCGTLLYCAICNTLLARKHGQRQKKKKEKRCLLFCNLGFVITSRFLLDYPSMLLLSLFSLYVTSFHLGENMDHPMMRCGVGHLQNDGNAHKSIHAVGKQGWVVLFGGHTPP